MGLSRNAVTSLVCQALGLVFSLLLGRALFRGLGADAFGVVMFTLTLNAILCAALDLGIGTTLVREVAARGHVDRAGAVALARTAGSLGWLGFGVVAVLLVVVAPWLVDRWVHLDRLESEQAVGVVRVLGVAALLGLPRSVYASLLRGLGRLDLTSALDVAALGGQLLGLVFLLRYGAGVPGVAVGLAIPLGLGLAGHGVAVATKLGFGALVPSWEPRLVATHRAYASRVAAVSLLALVHSYIDKLLVSRLLPIGAFGPYALASSGIGRGGLFAGSVAQAALPAFARLHAEADVSGLRAQYRRLEDLVAFAGVGVFGIVPFVVRPVFELVFDPPTADALFVPSLLLAVGFCMNATLHVPHALSLAVGRPDIATRSNALALLFVVPANVALVSAFGLVGAGAGWVVYHLFAYGYGMRRVARECLAEAPSAWYGRMLGWVLPGASLYAAAWAVAHQAGGGPVGLLAAYVICTLIYAVASWPRLDADLRHTVGARALAAWASIRRGSA